MPRPQYQRSRTETSTQATDDHASRDIEHEDEGTEPQAHEHAAQEEPQTQAPETAATPVVDTTGPSVYVDPNPPAPPSAHTMPEVPMSPAAPTMDDAFFTLCQAMAPLLADNVPAQTHCGEIQAWYTNGTPGSENHRMAWTHAVQLLEQVLNISLMQR